MMRVGPGLDLLQGQSRGVIARLRAATTLPICVGFGIARPEHAASVGRLADGVVVGSALVDAAGRSVEEAVEFTAGIRRGLDGIQ